MTTLRTAAQQALEALKLCIPKPRSTDDDYAEQGWKEHNAAITALRAALAEPNDPVAYDGWVLREVFDNGEPVGHREPTQKPVAWMDPNSGEVCRAHWLESHAPERDVGRFTCALYTAPPQRPPLTDEEIDRITDAQWASNNHKPIYAAHRAYARAIERTHGIGGQHEP